MWLFTRLGNPQVRVERPANLLVGVAVFPENVTQEHQLHMKAVLITQCTSVESTACFLDEW
jgi:hypothetical protein